MTQAHLDRLTSVDAGFLHQEDGGAHMHIGAVGIFEGPAPSGQAFRDHIASRLPDLPRYRHRLAYPPLGTGRPMWAEDEHFRLDYHVRHTALPAPGGEAELLTLVNRVVAQRLDRTKPLWEMWLVEGLEDGKFAVLSKTHHAMIDGVGGADLLTVLFDISADAPVRPVPPPFEAQRTPGGLGLLARGAEGLVRNVIDLTTSSVSLATDPVRAVKQVVHTASAIGQATLPLISGAPATPLNHEPGPHRLVSIVSTQLSDYKVVKQAYGATINDVVLTAVAGALGKFLAGRGMDTEGLTLRACVPVSLRASAKRQLGNEIAIMSAPLPVSPGNPVERLAKVRQSMEGLKGSKQAEGAKVLTSIENALPPAVLAQASRLGFSSRLYNLLVTNVPGPQVPIFMLGRELLELVPLAFLAPEHTLAIGIMSYNGNLVYGLLADADSVPDVDVLAKHLEQSLAELVASAQQTRVSA